jgi:hypothetical protein
VSDDAPQRKPVEHGGLTEARIAHIAGMMRRLEWIRGESGLALQVEWKLGKDRVEQLASEASKRVRAEVVDRDAVQETVACALDKVLRDASKKSGSKAARTVIQAAKVWSTVTGANAPKRFEINATISSYDDLQRRLAAQVAGNGEVPDADAVGGTESAGQADDRDGAGRTGVREPAVSDAPPVR